MGSSMKFIFLKIFFVLIITFLLDISPLFAERQSYLRPCYNDLMFNTYIDLLRKFLFTEKAVDYKNGIIRFLILESFKSEKHFVIYSTKNGEYWLEFTQPSKSIWNSMLRERSIKTEHKNRSLKIKDLQIKKHRKIISRELFDSIRKVWKEMVETLRFTSDNGINLLDGTTYFFSSGYGLCALAHNRGKEVSTLTHIAQKLIEYAKETNTSQDFERKIIKYSDHLYFKIQPSKNISID